MKFPKYLLITLTAASTIACTPKPKPVEHQAEKITDTTGFVKANPKNSSADTTIHTDIDTLEGKPVTADRLIIPGKSIGQTSIDESMETVFNKLGKPDSSDAAMGSALAVWYAGHNKQGYKTGVFSRHNYKSGDNIFLYVKRILVTSPYFKTAKGVGAGSTLEQINKQFKLKAGTGYTDKGKPIGVYNDIAKGISFEIDSIDNKCVGVIIQKPGDAAASYLNMN